MENILLSKVHTKKKENFVFVWIETLRINERNDHIDPPQANV